MTSEFDARVRAAAFAWLGREAGRTGGLLSFARLQQGLEVDGVRIPLLAMQGIFKPRALELPISLRTTPAKPGQRPPYEDLWDGDVRRYAFRKDDARGRVENNLLMRTMHEGIPLVYLIGLDPGSYYAEYPTYIVDADRASRTVTLSDTPLGARVSTTEERARYVTREVRTRLHQAHFRGRVLTAYRTSCAVCRLRHGELIDAAHIVPDRDDRGVPEVTNGLSLCKIHHAAFDADLVGIRPDLVVELRSDLLDEQDGPMLLHGLQEAHGRRLMVLPHRVADRPDRARLEERYEAFRAAG